jgi:hypothetical protein
MPDSTSSHSPFVHRPGLLVKYAGATNTKGSRWMASLSRGGHPETLVRATVSYQEGPNAAALAVVEKFNVVNGTTWTVDPMALSMDGGNTYAYSCLAG